MKTDQPLASENPGTLFRNALFDVIPKLKGLLKTLLINYEPGYASDSWLPVYRNPSALSEETLRVITEIGFSETKEMTRVGWKNAQDRKGFVVLSASSSCQERGQCSTGCGAAEIVKPKARPCESIYIVDSPRRNPKGCKESSRWSESAETTGNAILIGCTPEGCQNFRCSDPLR